MNRPLAAIAGALVIAFAVACGSAGDGSGPAAAPTADISSFPTPSVSRATRQPDPRPTSPAPTAQTPEDSEDSGSETADVPPISPEEIQELRERLGRGELSEEEAQEVFLRLREQFGGGQGGIGPGGFGGAQAAGTIENIDGNTITIATELATVTATLGENTNVSITSILEPVALTDSAQVIVVSERVEGSNLARSITVVPEGQGGFGGVRGGFGGGQAVAVKAVKAVNSVKAVKAVKVGWKEAELVRLLARSWTNKMAVSRSKPSRGLCRFQWTTTQSSLKPVREPLPTSKRGCESQ